MWQTASGLLTKENMTSPSTMKAIALVGGLLGYSIAPGSIEIIAEGVASIVALIEFVRKHQTVSSVQN